MSANLWLSIISVIALGCSVVSLYQSVFKQAVLAVYVGDLGHVVWDKSTEAEIVVLPVMVGNRGARDAVVLGFRLAADGAPNRYRSSLVGGPFAPAESFAPWEVPGRGSRSGTVQLRASDAAKLIVPPPSNGPVGVYALCLTIRTEAVRPVGLLERLLAPLGALEPPPTLRFEVEPLERFNSDDMEMGRWVPLEIKAVESIDDRRAADIGKCRAVVQQDAGVP